MPIVSVIVPVYKTEAYLAKCLDSLVNQTLKDIEIIVVNDGSPDNSQNIIDEYVKNYPEKVRSYIKENGGLSDARNYGVERAFGEYLMFVDSDDYLDVDALKHIYQEAEHAKTDVIGFNLAIVDENGAGKGLLSKASFIGLSGQDAMVTLVESKDWFEPACGFAYRTEYWKKHNFSFIKGIYHEDFALIPLVILLANSVSCLEYNDYFYVSTDNSITRTQTNDRKARLANDLLCGIDFLISECFAHSLEKTYAGKLYLAYVANAAIYRLESLQGELKKSFRSEIRKRKLSNYIIDDTFKRKIRKLLLRIKNRI